MIVSFLRKFTRGQWLRDLLDTRNLNRIVNILEDIEGEGCRIEKPLDQEGRGWKVVVDIPVSDTEGRLSFAFAPYLPLDVKDADGSEEVEPGQPRPAKMFHHMPALVWMTLNGSAEVTPTPIGEGVYFLHAKLVPGERDPVAEIRADAARGREEAVTPVAAVKRTREGFIVRQLFHGDQAQYRYRVFRDKSLELEQETYDKGPTPTLYRWVDALYGKRVASLAELRALTLICRVRAPAPDPPPPADFEAEDYEGKNKLHEISGDELVTETDKKVHEDIWRVFFEDPDLVTQEAVVFFIHNHLASILRYWPQRAILSPPQNLFFGAVSADNFGGWAGASKEVMLQEGAVDSAAVETVSRNLSELEASMESEPLAGTVQRVEELPGFDARNDAAREKAIQTENRVRECYDSIIEVAAELSMIENSVATLEGACDTADADIRALEGR